MARSFLNRNRRHLRQKKRREERGHRRSPIAQKPAIYSPPTFESCTQVVKYLRAISGTYTADLYCYYSPKYWVIYAHPDTFREENGQTVIAKHIILGVEKKLICFRTMTRNEFLTQMALNTLPDYVVGIRASESKLQTKLDLK